MAGGGTGVQRLDANTHWQRIFVKSRLPQALPASQLSLMVDAPKPPADPFSRRRPARTGRRLVWALSRASMVALAVAITAAASIISPIGTRREARETAVREIDALLAADEVILARAYASQRRASDLWRQSHGLLVATNRRVLYLGAPPITLLRPDEGGPPELYLEAWSLDATFTIDADTSSNPKRISLRTPTRTVSWRIDDEQFAAADSVRLFAERARRLQSEEAERLGRTGTLTPMPDRYTTHVVRRGETLTSIARDFGTSIEVVRQLNRLTSDNVRAGQRLRVPELRSDGDPFADSIGSADDPSPPFGPPPGFE